MTRKTILLFILASIVVQGKVFSQTIATFEDNNKDLFDSLTWTAKSGSLGVVDNPSKLGINTSQKCLLNYRVKGSSSAWTESGSFCSRNQKPLLVQGDKHYLHVFVYSDQSYAGLIRLRYTSADNKWLSPAKESRFTFKAGEWSDVVFDLKAASVDSIYGFYFMSQDWSGSSYGNDSYFYYDEIEVTDNPNARGIAIKDSACTVADFEKDGITPSYVMYGSNGGSTMNLSDNTDTKGLNSSSKALKIIQSNESVWWSRANLTFNEPVKVTDQTRYLHFYAKSPSSTLSVLTYEPSEHWFPNVSIPVRNEWSDVVVDLMSTSYNLQGKTLTSIGICANTTTYIPKMDWCVDQVVFNANPNRRTGDVSDLDSLNCELTTNDDDWTFVDQIPSSKLVVTNRSTKSVKFVLQIDVRTDAKKPFQCVNDTLTLPAQGSATVNHTLSAAVPGFYRYYINVLNDQYIRNKVIRQIAYNPEKIVSNPDSLVGFTQFWNTAKAELAKVAPEYTVTYKETVGSHKIYDVSMKSIKGNTIRGYFSVPDKNGKFPVIVHSNGYAVTATEPDRTDDYAVFSYNIRGMGISTDYSATDEAFVNGLKDINTYYYRECFMDAIRAVDFVCSRPEVDTTKVFAEGESQGGALTFVIAALDKRIVAAAAMVPFLSDFTDYYNIKENVTEIPEWPMNYINQYMDKYTIGSDSIFKNLTYFDIRNLAGKIKCPLLMAVGMQDETCPPRTNFAAYNQVKTDKEYKVYKADGHYVDRSFLTYKDAWFNAILDKLKTALPETAFPKGISGDVCIYTEGHAINIHSLAPKPVTASVYGVSGILINRSVIGGSINIPVKPGIYIVELKGGRDKLTRKVAIY